MDGWMGSWVVGSSIGEGAAVTSGERREAW
jgi:hypothetical protein